MRPPPSGSTSGVRVARWSAAVVILVIAALLGGLAVVAGYLRAAIEMLARVTPRLEPA